MTRSLATGVLLAFGSLFAAGTQAQSIPALSITAPIISADPIVNVGETDGSVVLMVELDRASSGTVTVEYFTFPGNAQENQDYAATAGTLTFAAGDTSRTITVPIIDDAGYDRLRLLFFVALRNASGATLPAPNYAQVVIQDDEPKPTVTIEDVAVYEADGRMTLTLRLSHTSSDAIRYLTPANGSLVSGTATAAVDYGDFLQGSDAVITMPVRALSATFDIAIVDDTEEEGDETIGIVWRKHPDDFAVPASLAFIGTIKDNDTNGPNAAPTFTEGAAATRSVPETVGGATVTVASHIGDAVTATDTDAGDTLEYSVTGADAARFTIVSTSGQLRTRVGETYDYETDPSYAVTVRVEDGHGGSDTIAVTLGVTNAVEAPLAPAAPTVTATSGDATSLDVSWRAPENAGRPAITTYDLQYTLTTVADWTDGPQNQTGASARITGLAGNTTYEVRVRATNGDGDGAWSENASASTGPNAAPTFTEGAAATRSVPETVGGAAVTVASHIGDAVTATDTDAGDTLEYSVAGADAATFTIVSTSGQLRTRAGETYDYETDPSYAVTVRVENGHGGSATIAVTINVTDQVEAPLAPAAPTVTATSGDATSLDVSWRAPENAGRPAITTYDLQYTLTTVADWTDGPQNQTGASARITGLAGNTTYEVRVRATNGDGDGAWSENASVSTGPNAAPTFTEGAAATRSVPETVGGAAVTVASHIGDAVTATDTDAGDTLEYSVAGADAATFTIVSTSGQLRTRAGETYDYETDPSYAVTVRVEDGHGGSATIAVTINVTDQVEAPLAPAAPTVTATSRDATSLDVSWRAPENAGRPAITTYDLQYTLTTVADWTDGPQNQTGASARITGLAGNTTYEVRVRATNGDGDGAWSENASASTGAPTPVPTLSLHATALLAVVLGVLGVHASRRRYLAGGA